MSGFVRAAIGLGVGCASAAGQLGPVTPPAGPVGDTGPHLGEIEPRIPISDATTPGDSTSRYRIQQPGTYYLTEDVIVTTDVLDGIEIDAADVTIDLMGFRLVNTSATPGDGVDLGLTGSSFTLRNGTIRSWERGVRTASNVNRSRFERVRFESNLLAGLDAEDDVIVEHCEAWNNTGPGFDVGENATFRWCVAAGNTGTGFFSESYATVIECEAHDNGGDGFSLLTGSLVSNCRAALNSGDGIQVTSDSKIADCLSEDNEGIGVRAAFDCRIEQCMVTSNTSGGILGTTDTTVDSNTVTDNSVYGISCGGGLIIRNALSGNTSPQILTNNGAAFGPIVSVGGLLSEMSPWANILH